MVLAKLKGIVYLNDYAVNVEFGRSQLSMAFSKRGKIGRKLKLKDGDKVEVTIKKLKKK